METFLHSISSVAVVLSLTAVGYFCSAMGWIDAGAKSFLGKYVLRLALPVMCAYSLRNNLTRELLFSSGSFLLVPIVTGVVLLCASFLIGSALKLPRASLGVFALMCSMSNALFIGYPMCLELFGEACTPYVMLYYLINTTFVQMVGLPVVRWSGEHERHTLGQSLLAFVKTPSVLGVLAGIALVLADVRPPSFLMSAARYIAGTPSPLGLVLAGHVVHEIGLRNVRIDRTLSAAMGFRFILAPALCLALCALLGVGGLGRSVLAVETAMPVVTQTVVAAAEYGADERLAARGIAFSTLAGFVVTPVLMLLL